MVEGPNCHIMKAGKTQNQDTVIKKKYVIYMVFWLESQKVNLM
jgi:hypothetical protein